MLVLLMMMMTIFNISGYYREAPVVVLRGPHQPHQQQAHQHQAQHQQQVSFSSSDLEAMEAKKSKEKGPTGLVWHLYFRRQLLQSHCCKLLAIVGICSHILSSSISSHPTSSISSTAPSSSLEQTTKILAHRLTKASPGFQVCLLYSKGQQ